MSLGLPFTLTSGGGGGGTPVTPGGVSGQVQYNNAGGFSGLNLWFESANVVSQRNGTNAQIKYIYNTESGSLANFERGYCGWFSNEFRIGAESGGTGVANRLVCVYQNGLERARFTSSNVAIAYRLNLGLAGSGALADGGYGIVRLSNSDGNGFNRLEFGGNSSSWPALKRSGAELHARLADDSADTSIRMLYLETPSVTAASLGSASPAGKRRVVNDANATTFNSIVAGGGANVVPVFSDGTNWRIG